MKGLLSEIKNLFRPNNFSCYSCGKEIFDGSFLCGECLSLLKKPACICDKCGRAQAEEGICEQCKLDLPDFDGARSCYPHEDTARNVLLKYKNGERAYKDFLTEKLYETFVIHYAAYRFDEIVYLPATRGEEWQRGFHPPRELAEWLSKQTGIPLSHALKKVKRTKKQKSLSSKERKQNVKDAFRADKSVKDKAILLLDDVMTTGATANEASKTLKKKGAKAVFLLTFTSVSY